MRWDGSLVVTDAARSADILLITDRYLPEVGGTITWFHNMAMRFAPGTVSIVTRDYPGSKGVDTGHPGVNVYRLGLRRYPFLRPESLLIYAKLLAVSSWVVRRRRISVVHAGKVLPEGLVAYWIARLFGVPYLVYAHGEEITIFGQNPAYAKVVPKVYKHAAAVVANSRFTREQLVRVGVSEARIACVNPGVDPHFFKPAPPDGGLVTRYGLERKTALLSVGRLIRRKGHDKVIEAVAQLLPEHPDLVYLVLGAGEDEGYLRKIVQGLGVAHAVRFAGEVPCEELPRFYNTADIFVLANRWEADGNVEGFGIVFLEANACGKAVIAGTSGGTGDAVRDGYNGLRVDGDDAGQIREAIRRLLTDPGLRERLGAQGRRLVEAECTWDRVFEKLRAVSDAIRIGAELAADPFGR